MAGIAFTLIGILDAQSVATDNFRTSFSVLIWSAFVINIVYLVIYRPKIILFDEGITIRNPFQEFKVGWDRVDEIETRFTMSIQVDGKMIYAWAAPAPGRHHARSIHPTEVRWMNVGAPGIIRPGESPRSDSGVASYLAKLRWNNYKSKKLVGATSTMTYNKIGIAISVTTLLIGIALNCI
jgi:hypothetical protein